MKMMLSVSLIDIANAVLYQLGGEVTSVMFELQASHLP